MKRVTGIGGIFFKANDAPALQAWYKRHLGIDSSRGAAPRSTGPTRPASRRASRRIGPLQTVSLGFFPNKNAHVSTTCAAVFVDVRTGSILAQYAGGPATIAGR
jgi:hypothetical protein